MQSRARKKFVTKEIESDELFTLKCYVCESKRGEGGLAFRSDCSEGITYLPQLDGIWDTGGLYCCGVRCITWLVRKAKKYGYQTSLIVKYDKKKYNREGPFSEWVASIMKTRHFVAMVQEKEAEEKQKKETARAEKRAREEEAKNRQVLEAAAAEPTQPLVASTTVEDPSAAASAAASSVTAYDGLNLTSVPNRLPVDTALCLLETVTARMRRTIAILSTSTTGYSGGTISDNAARVMTLNINCMDKYIRDLKVGLGYVEDDCPASKKLKKS